MIALTPAERVPYTARVAGIGERFAEMYDRKVTELRGHVLRRFYRGVDAALAVSRETIRENGEAILARFAGPRP